MNFTEINGDLFTAPQEQDLLDVMQGQVVQHQAAENTELDNTEKCENTILQQLGLKFEECTANDIAVIKSALGSCADKFYKAWKVKNIKTQKRLDESDFTIIL